MYSYAHFGPKPRADHRHADEQCCPVPLTPAARPPVSLYLCFFR
jgi:hypothetical protein